jgi:hypothetical protein
MPIEKVIVKYSAIDAPTFKKDLSRKQKRKWAVIANSAYASCVEGGGEDKQCSMRAVKIANSKFEYEAPFNPVINGDKYDQLEGDMKSQMNDKLKKCMDSGSSREECMAKMKKEMALIEDKLKKDFDDLGDCEMEIFRCGTHNGDKFIESDLEEIASNFHKLKDELRPKLKITHRENQETIGGLASYGDIVDVFLRRLEDGSKRLFAKLSNIPKEVLDLIKNRRFPERSIEIYPRFKLGTKDDSPIYKNVLKAIALLGHEMPAVPGMAPIKLEECIECQGTMCFRESFVEPQKSSDKIIELSPELIASFNITRKNLSLTMEEVKTP